jgi:alanyl-tRNA synthetase
MSPEEIKRVEQLVNEQALMAQPVTSYVDIALEDARKMGAMALFGEKYADRVRVVQIGGMPPQDPSYSRELCGGVHVKNTGEIGLFKILHESSAASGVRRIVAVTGRGAMDWANDQGNLIHQAAQKLKSTPKDMLAAIDKMGEALREERKKREKLAQSGSGSQAELTKVGPVELAVESIEGELRDAQAVADRLVDSRPDRVALVSCLADGKVVFVAKCGPGAVASGVHAGNLVKAVASVTGGGGGGRPDFATAGGRDASKIQEALVAGLATVRSQVSSL